MVQVQREFVADASHELRTPLTSILANLELLQASLEAPAQEDERAMVDSALRSSGRMSRLVADLLLLALFVLSVGMMTSSKFLPGIYGKF